MYLHSLETALPDTSFTQGECWELVRQSRVRERLTRRSMLVLGAILRGDSGVARRHFAVRDVGRIFDLEADELNAAFRQAAPALAGKALGRAFASANVGASGIDALIVCSCTGYLCPGVSSYVAESMGLRPDVFLLDVMGHGCGAAVPSMRCAAQFLAANPGARVATVAVEICSAAFYLDDDPGVLVSACIFADGAAAAVWSDEPRKGSRHVHVTDFSSLHLPGDRDRLRFEQRNGKLRNLLDPAVPLLAARAVSELRASSGASATDRVVAHPGGRDVLDALEPALAAGPLEESREVLRDCGNMSSPSVLFALERALTRHAGSGDWWLVSFGAGFTAHGCRLAVAADADPPPVAAEHESPQILAAHR